MASERVIDYKLRRLQDGNAPRLVDLFSGCGGMSLGFQAAGYDVLAGIELEPLRAQTHARNFHRHLGPEAEKIHGESRDVTVLEPLAEIGKLTGQAIPDVDVLVGGPPCQAYARVGRAKLREIAEHPQAYRQDPRGQLWAAYIRWVEALKPIAVVMENVPDILNYGGDQVAETIAENLDLLGYEVRYTLLNAAFFGVPQTRERWYLIGIHKSLGTVPAFPIPSHFVELPRGYTGTRSHALSWNELPEEERPVHAVLLQAASTNALPAISCKAAISDLPAIPPDVKNRRGARNLDVQVQYAGLPSNEYQRLMRQWRPGMSQEEFRNLPVLKDVGAHVIRYLPRDWDTFREMRQGDLYPQAWEVAWTRFERELGRLRRAGEKVEENGARWIQVRDAIVPPYDRSKFPNKWWKLQENFPSRTLLAHLSHDSYSHIHYSDAEARTISVREAARLQSFPDSFEFCGAMNAAFGQIGNAVPPLMAKALGEQLLSQLQMAKSKQPATRRSRSSHSRIQECPLSS